MVSAVLGSAGVISSLALLAACSPQRTNETADAAVFEDAAADAEPLPSGPSCMETSFVYMPVTVTGTSPSGPLDDFHYARASYVDHSCLAGYEIQLTSAEREPSYPEPWLRLWIEPPFSTSGTNRAKAFHETYPEVMTDNVTFEATRLDLPDATPPQIIGHFVSHEDGWSFDIAIDLTSQCTVGCIDRHEPATSRPRP